MWRTKFYFNQLCFGLFGLLLFPLSGVSQTTEIYSTSGTWQVPCGVTSVTIAVYGGGGGGGGSNSGGLAGGGGGAGGYAEATFAVSPGDMIPYTVGTGGSGGGPAGNGGTGGQSNLNPFSGLSALGGTGGFCENAGGGGGTGGTGSGWAINITGNNGNPGGVIIGGHGGNNDGPNGGSAGLGAGAGLNGGNAGDYGAGGGGGGDKDAGANTSGGNGSSGAVVFTYTSTVTRPDAGADINLCGVTNLSGNIPDAGWTGTWSLVSGSATITSPNSPTTAISGIAAGSCATFRWSFTMLGCLTLTDEVTICNPLICNDNPCGATPIGVSTTGCSYTQYSNSGATPTTGVVEPGCGNYSDNDVWFTMVVPANGQITIQAVDNGAPGSVYPAIAVYEGTCTDLLHAGCDQTTSTITPSEISYNGTPGSTIYVRVWDYFYSESGFGLCAYTHTNPTGSVLPGTTSVTCGTPMTFMDPGGSGNYSVNSSSHYIICPDTPGEFVTIDFLSGANFFDIENGFDAMTILDGGGLDAPIIGQYTGTNNPGEIISGAPDGCLTIMFMSDNIVTDFGWLATVSCTTEVVTNTYVCSPTNCSGECGQWICQDGLYPTTNDGNGIEDLAMGTSGCFGAAGEIASKWFYFTILTDGTIEFSFNGPNGQDYDFAVWGPSTDGNPPCPFNTGEGPIRCSFAANGSNPVGLNAGLSGGEQFEGVEGDGWVDALNTVAGETYAMILNIYQNGNPQPDIDLTIGGTGTIDCAPVFLPVEMHSLNGINQGEKNFISWVTNSELNNDFFTLERSINGFEWAYAGTIDGAGTSVKPIYYSLYDYQPNLPVTYYRVKQTDFDGKFEYSDVIAVNAKRIPGDNIISELFPNPANSYVTFTYNGTKVSGLDPLNIRVVDKLGTEVMNYNYVELLAGMPTTLRTSELASGTYQLIATQGGNSFSQKLVIIR